MLLFTLFPSPRQTKGQFSFCTINLHPKLVTLSLWDYNITLSLAIQGKGFFGEWFQHSKSGLVCILNHCTLLRSSSLFPFTPPCSDSSLWTPRCYLRPVVSAGGRLRPAQGQVLTEWPACPKSWRRRCGHGACGWRKSGTWRSWGRGPSVYSPFEQLYSALPQDSKCKLPGGI